MKKRLLLVLSFLISISLFPQSVTDAGLQLSAQVQASPPQITLSWPGNSTTSQYQVFRKLKEATSWGAAVASLNGSTNQYSDNTISPGTSYEYRIVRTGSGYTGYGYINSGVNVPETHHRGTVVLLVDSTFIAPLSSEIARLIKDIEGDGWNVRRHDVDRNGTVYHVKDLIVADHAIDSAELKAVFILGHVPVPYSGNINPDGHGDHLGAWPADCYYGDVDGIWTDVLVTSTTASPARTQNVPGDGKFDQSIIPSDMELQVGRVDFNGLSAFTATEQQLLKDYLDKDHDYRKKIYQPMKRAVVDDNFGYFSGEAFAASGYKNFGPLVGTASITAADYFTSMAAGSYLWSYGCGGGTYTSASGVGTTANFASSSLQGVFTMLFGSYFGDWDAPNSFLKAPLAQGKVLTSVWSGRPHYQFHHMGLGENIGYDLMLTQNNPNNLYYASPTGITGRWIHNALMGDPTLRTDVLLPVSNVVATRVNSDCHISWSASTETALAGYNVYVRNDSIRSYTKINSGLIAGTTYTDYCLLYPGVYSYQVRAVKLEVTPSGSYYNMSEGIADTALNVNNYAAVAAFTYSLSSGTTVNFNNSTNVPATYQWDFGNGTTGSSANPVVTYTANGNYFVTLIAGSACYNDTSYQLISINQVGLQKHSPANTVVLAPNPGNGLVRISFDQAQAPALRVLSVEGKEVYSKEKIASGEETDLRHLSRGLYFVQVGSGSSAVVKKLLIE